MLNINENIEKWVDEIFDFSSIFLFIPIKDEQVQEKIGLIQSKCSDKIQKLIEERIVPYISASRNKLQTHIQYIVEKYITAVSINNSQIISSVELQLKMKNDSLFPVFSPLPIAATMLMVEKSILGIMGVAFAPLLSILVTLGVGWNVYLRNRKKQKIVSSIKEQIGGYSLVSKYIQSIMRNYSLAGGYCSGYFFIGAIYKSI